MENKFLRWMTENTQTVYWHDSAVLPQLEEALSNGAAGMTTNPFLVSSTLHSERTYWADYLKDIPKGLTGDEKVEALARAVTGFYAKKLYPIYQKGMFGKGYVCAQTNPNKTGDADYMMEQANRIATWGENIVIKLPATRAGIEVYEECVAMGRNVAATVSFSVPQVLAVGAAQKRGAERAKKNGIKTGLNIAVLMVGRLDDYLRDVAHDTKAAVSENDIISAGTACIKRAYKIFGERDYEAVLMPAGCRGAYHIADIAGAKMITSTAPKIASLLAKMEGPFEERINVPVEKEIIDRLLTMPEFRKAYEPDGLSLDEFIGFGATNRTTTQFIESGWSPILNYEY